jgi:hypothetical protein
MMAVFGKGINTIARVMPAGGVYALQKKKAP